VAVLADSYGPEPALHVVRATRTILLRAVRTRGAGPLARLWPGFFSSSPTDFLFYFSRARVDIFLLFLFHQTYIYY
jgi:hypothetical protein